MKWSGLRTMDENVLQRLSMRMHLQRDLVRDSRRDAERRGMRRALWSTPATAWLTQEEIGKLTQYPDAIVSVHLHSLREAESGAYFVEERPRGGKRDGPLEYRLTRK